MHILPYVLVNGYTLDQLSVFDRGFAYGDGLFETLLIHHGEFSLWPQHKARLIHGCLQLAIPCPLEDIENDLQLIGRYLAENNLLSTDHILKIIVSRGVGTRGYKAPRPQRSTRVVALLPSPDYPEANTEGVHVRLCETRLSRNQKLAGLKHLNRLEQVLARMEWDDESIAEGLMMDEFDKLIEGTSSNLFLVTPGKKLVTPHLTYSGVKGVMRQFIVETIAPALGVECIDAEVSLHDLNAADEVFICNSVFGVWPVVSLLGTSLQKSQQENNQQQEDQHKNRHLNGTKHWHKGSITSLIQAQVFSALGKNNHAG